MEAYFRQLKKKKKVTITQNFDLLTQNLEKDNSKFQIMDTFFFFCGGNRFTYYLAYFLQCGHEIKIILCFYKVK